MKTTSWIKIISPFQSSPVQVPASSAERQYLLVNKLNYGSYITSTWEVVITMWAQHFSVHHSLVQHWDKVLAKSGGNRCSLRKMIKWKFRVHHENWTFWRSCPIFSQHEFLCIKKRRADSQLLLIVDVVALLKEADHITPAEVLAQRFLRFYQRMQYHIFGEWTRVWKQMPWKLLSIYMLQCHPGLMPAKKMHGLDSQMV